jgi:hypothetical protein
MSPEGTADRTDLLVMSRLNLLKNNLSTCFLIRM